MKQHNSKRTCNATNTTSAFLGSTRMQFQCILVLFGKGNQMPDIQCPSQQLQSYAGNNYSRMNIWKTILQSFLFVVIGGDAYNKIFVLWDEEEKLKIQFFAYWNGFSKIPIKVRCLCKLLLNKTFPWSESQKNPPLKELQKIINLFTCLKMWSAVPVSFWGLFG